jgi:ATP-dependent Clp protease protease subunit
MKSMLKLFALNRGAPRKFEVQAAADEVTIYLYDVIVSDTFMAEFFGGVDPLSFAKALHEARGKAVTLRINCPGGDVFAARAMAQHVREHDRPVKVIVDGYAASAATVVAVAASRIDMAPGSMFMIHKSWSVAIGNADDFLATAALLEQVDGALADSYHARCTSAGKDTKREELTAAMAAETWYTPDGAVAVGLVDGVLAEESANSQQAKWDLSAYAHAPVAASAANITPTASRIDALRRQLALHQRAA